MADRKPNILLIDDDLEFVNEMTKLYSKVYRIIKCPTKKGVMAFMKNLSGQIDLIALDLYLDMRDRPDGLELIKTLKQYAPPDSHHSDHECPAK